ncbi:putative glycerol-1-phosphate prenyltransferase [Heliophilum fasciatum]|uniref:heptaprenylglyceryl phosphate synthase n=1 Tax=Heliophilum fasciatum TaxID=35700 RepID=UPI001404713E|nr:heptaprenylglyceryl phosphate synthase [Heliophilum fasciatum]MCW2279302.1 putative glycerol-1-phosphate prenyltransferase [Heliophilum fasciatum]
MATLLVKLDPGRELEDARWQAVLRSGADGIIVGGTQDITADNLASLWRRVRDYPGQRIVEVTVEGCTILDADQYWVPMVLNAPNAHWLLGAQSQALARQQGSIPWERVLPIGYVVLNPRSAVAQLTEAQTNMDDEQLAGLVQMSHRLLGIPWLYFEYSGIWGDAQRMARLRGRYPLAPMIYGGGITCAWQAKTMSQYCDQIVVGNVVYESADLAQALQEIREAIKN